MANEILQRVGVYLSSWFLFLPFFFVFLGYSCVLVAMTDAKITETVRFIFYRYLVCSTFAIGLEICSVTEVVSGSRCAKVSEYTTDVCLLRTVTALIAGLLSRTFQTIFAVNAIHI